MPSRWTDVMEIAYGSPADGVSDAAYMLPVLWRMEEDLSMESSHGIKVMTKG